MSRRVGLDAGSRDVLLDLIYRLSLDDAGDRGRSDGRTRDSSDARGRAPRPVGGGGAVGDAADAPPDADAALRARAKEARRAERERERKEKVLRRALRADRRRPAGGDGDVPGSSSAAEGRAAPRDRVARVRGRRGGHARGHERVRGGEARDRPARPEPRRAPRQGQGEAQDEEETPERVRARPPGPRLADTLSLLPMASVILTPDPPPAPADEEARNGDAAAGAAEDGDAEDGDAARADEAPAAEAEAEAEAEERSSNPSRRYQKRPPGGRRTPLLSSAEADALSASFLASHAASVTSASDPFSRASLPAWRAKASIVAAVEESGAALTVLVGATGSGKTTQAPQFVLERWIETGRGGACSIIVAQPRRVAAVTVARRVAEGRGEAWSGTSSGTRRGERRRRLATHEGHLLHHRRAAPATRRRPEARRRHARVRGRGAREKRGRGRPPRAPQEDHEGREGDDGEGDDGEGDDGGRRRRGGGRGRGRGRGRRRRRGGAESSRIERIERAERGAVVVRSVVRRLERKRKPRRALLKVVLMSATADADAFARYFSGTGAPGSPDPPTPRVEGRAFPVEERFAPEERSRPRDRVAEASASASASGGGGFVDYDRLARVAVDVAEEMSVAETRDGSPPGAILAFLPGAPEIERAEKAVRAAFEKHLFSGPGPRRRNGKTPVPRGGGRRYRNGRRRNAR